MEENKITEVQEAVDQTVEKTEDPASKEETPKKHKVVHILGLEIQKAEKKPKDKANKESKEPKKKLTAKQVTKRVVGTVVAVGAVGAGIAGAVGHVMANKDSGYSAEYSGVASGDSDCGSNDSTESTSGPVANATET